MDDELLGGAVSFEDSGMGLLYESDVGGTCLMSMSVLGVQKCKNLLTGVDKNLF